MYKLFDFLEINCNKTFRERKFCIADIMVVTQLPNSFMEQVNYSTFKCSSKSEFLSYIKTIKKDKEKFKWQKMYSDLLSIVLSSKRYEDLEILDFVSLVDKKRVVQYCIATLRLDNKIFVSYGGTGLYIAAWLENLVLAYKSDMQSQVECAEYLNKVSKKYKNITLCGFSKGGNLALYSAFKADDIDNIYEIYNFEGQGLDLKYCDSEKWKNLQYKTHNYIPQLSTVGMMLGFGHNFNIAISDRKGFMQHDLFGWWLKDDKIVDGKEVKKISRIIYMVFHDFLCLIDDDSKKIFIQSLLKVLSPIQDASLSYSNFYFIKKLPMIIKEQHKLPKDNKLVYKQVKKFIIKSVKNYNKILKEISNNK